MLDSFFFLIWILLKPVRLIKMKHTSHIIRVESISIKCLMFCLFVYFFLVFIDIAGHSHPRYRRVIRYRTFICWVSSNSCYGSYFVGILFHPYRSSLLYRTIRWFFNIYKILRFFCYFQKYFQPLKSPENSGLIEGALVDEIFYQVSILLYYYYVSISINSAVLTWRPFFFINCENTRTLKLLIFA